MIKVFLVEDEVVMRNGIKNNIQWEREGFTFAGEASDGELAYPLILKEKPDILITDIRMPFMDGLELSRLVKQELPQIKIIILSGYNDFDYAKTAIEIGVTDYLLKPVGSAKLLEAVKRVADIIETEQENERILRHYRKEMEESVRLGKYRLWSELASNRLSTEELLRWGEKLGIDFTAPAYLILLFKVSQGGDASGCSKELMEASDQIAQFAEQWEQVLPFDRSPEGWAFLIKGVSDDELHERLAFGQERMTGIVAKYPDLEYFGGVGTPVYSIGDIRVSYLAAAKAFSFRFFTGANRLVEADSFAKLHEREQIDIRSLKSKREGQELVEKFLKSGLQDEVPDFLEEYFRSAGEENIKSFLYRQYLVMDLYFIVKDFLGTLGLCVEDLDEQCRDINRIVTESASVEGAIEQLKELFRNALRLRDGNSRKKYSALLEEAKTYIQENYQKEEMSLQNVAAKVNISPNYFSAIFSAEVGKTFIEYLTQVRLEKAKELLVCSPMRTAEIGYEIGYKDSHYFSYIFKKVVGCSPKEYRNRRKE